jgi:hypothetical protein
MGYSHFLTDTGRVEEAVPLLRCLIATDPNLAQAHWNLAYAYRFGGLIRESINEAEFSKLMGRAWGRHENFKRRFSPR